MRTAAGLFDVSHMGEIEIAGKDALAAVQHLSSNDASRLQVGQAHYAALTTPEGTFVDDMLVYRFAPSHFLLVVNGSNVDKDHAWMAERAQEAGDAAVVNSSDRYALIAIQGPTARGRSCRALTAIDLAAIKYYWFAHGEMAGVRGTVSRTGYTGEDGFEMFVPPAMAPRVWDAMLDCRPGRRAGAVRPRRPRHAAPRSGDAPLRQRHRRHDHRARGRPGVDRGVEQGRRSSATRRCGSRRRPASRARSSASRWSIAPSPGTAIPSCRATQQVGYVTSGTQTPFLKKAIGMAYVPCRLTEPGTELDIDIRGRRAKATVVPMPFYKRPTKGTAQPWDRRPRTQE